MSAALRIIAQARGAGLSLHCTSSGALSYSGPRAAFERLRPALVADKVAVIEELRAEERRLLEWWKSPVEGWNEGRIRIANIVSGVETTIDLHTGETVIVRPRENEDERS